VPLSTSSSDQKSTHGRWLRTVGAGLLAALVLLGGWEMFWRGAGFSPAIEDDLGIWAVKRRAVEDEKGPLMVLLGSSRIQLDVEPRIIQAETGYKPMVLAIDGSSPLPVLADLAASSFDGVVLCSLLPQWLADGGPGKSRSAKWVRKFHEQKWSFWIETRLSLLLQENFVFRYPGLLPGKLWEKFRENELPRPPYAPMRSDRYRPADYTKTDVGRLRAARVRRQQEIAAAAEPLSGREFAERISEIREMADQIRDKGGEVIFLRLPSCNEILEIEEATWPRSRYWDRFASVINGRALHFADYPELSRFDCPDGSHLDYRDAGPFTRSLIDILGLR